MWEETRQGAAGVAAQNAALASLCSSNYGSSQQEREAKRDGDMHCWKHGETRDRKRRRLKRERERRWREGEMESDRERETDPEKKMEMKRVNDGHRGRCIERWRQTDGQKDGLHTCQLSSKGVVV